ncbi:MAG TPA: hypothetical protein VK154_14460 [Chitinophagales bacterium]|nr:hypothetical protein [Chitinophagales bacterium]
MWALLELCLAAATVLIFTTEFLIPVLFNKPLFGSFRKAQPKDKHPETATDSLPEKIAKAKEKADEAKLVVEKVQDEAYKNYKAAEELKDESNKLL